MKTEKKKKEDKERIENEEAATLNEDEEEAAFTEGAADEEPEQKPPDSSGTSDEPGSEEEPHEDKTKSQTDEEDEEEEPKEGDDKPTYEDISQALKDTKTWGVNLSEQLQRAKDEIAELKKETTPTKTGGGKGDDEETPAAGLKIPDNVKEFLEDYPQMEPTIKLFAEQIAKQMVADKFGEVDISLLPKKIENLEKNLGQQVFINSVIGGFRDPKSGDFTAGHPDAVQVMASKEFKEYYAKQKELNPTVEHMDDPKDAIHFIGSYKKHRAKIAAEEHDDTTQAGTREHMEELGTGSPELGTGQHQSGAPKGSDAQPKTDEEEEKLFDMGANSKD